MNISIKFKKQKTPIFRKLFLYMFTLALIILSFLSSNLYFFGYFSSIKEKVSKDLSFQLSVFERQILKYYENLTIMGTSLSNDVSKITDNYLTENNIQFDDINDNMEHIKGLQNSVFDKLHQELLKTDCSGAFIIFNLTVNTTIENSQFSKTGLYFQRSSIDASDESLLLYRGIAELGRDKGIMPHRKWRLEFQTNFISNWDNLVLYARTPVEKFTNLTNVFYLPGTSERAMHFIIPVISSSNILYGFCGFEINESYFKTNFAQATQLEYLTCMLTEKQDGIIDPSSGFCAGVFGGYHFTPNEKMKIKEFGSGLVSLNATSSNIAKIKDIKLCNHDYVLSVMTPKDNYNKMLTENAIHITLLILILLCVTITICIFFSKKFLSPLLKDLEQIHKQEHKKTSSKIAEIDDLFIFLAKQDKLHEEENDELRKEYNQQKDELNKAKNEIARLSYSRKTEIDPDNYEIFKQGITLLTKTEKTIFKLYLEGKTTNEILEICKIQKSTLKYHNHNILGKLGVSSIKQMLRYATLLKQEKEDNK